MTIGVAFLDIFIILFNFGIYLWSGSKFNLMCAAFVFLVFLLGLPAK